MVICLERGAHLHMAQLMPLPLTVSCFSKIKIGFTFLVPARLGSPGQIRAVKRVCVCVCVSPEDCSKFAVKSLLRIPPHVVCVATLPCETLMSENKHLTYARCGGILNNHFTANLLEIFQWENFEYRLKFDRNMATSLVCSFLAHPEHATKSYSAWS